MRRRHTGHAGLTMSMAIKYFAVEGIHNLIQWLKNVGNDSQVEGTWPASLLLDLLHNRLKTFFMREVYSVLFNAQHQSESMIDEEGKTPCHLQEA